MRSLAVTLFLGFVEDRRWSMEVFADNLIASLESLYGDCLHLRQYRPSPPPLARDGLLQMRLSRFIIYPWQAHHQDNQVNHILDQGYGHLLYTLDPQRTVVTVHDLVPLARWRGKIAGVDRGHRPWLNEFSFNALRRAAHLMADSERTRRDLIELCGCDPDRVTVVHLGMSPVFHQFTEAERSQTPRDEVKRVLIVGAPFYKNRIGALRVFARLLKLCAFPLELIAVGAITTEWMESVKRNGLEEYVRCVEVSTHDQMAALYNTVDCLLFPSLYEGFGWPPLEAMACGVPVVASNVASLPEIIGDAGVMKDPLDVEGLAGAISGVLSDANLRATLIGRGLNRAREFTWEKTALQTWAVYEQIACTSGAA